ncbi:MAG: AMP-binding protein, partial [Alphaproteobacteria bacterium]|nr:AMP-binding protein [Alphaproteobacteria bacterium]
MMFPRFNPEDAMKMIQKHKTTFFPAVPTIYNLISNHPDVKKYDLSSIKACLSGGAALPVEVKREFEELTGCKLIEAYGLSETSPAATANPLNGLNKEASIGIPFPGTIVKIMSLEDPLKEMLQGEKGEICISGPQVMKGYWNRPAETGSSLVKGLFHTGDVGYMDEDGYTFLVDRIKDLIICSGYNVYPRVIEEAIYLHPAVEETTVIGVPDKKRGETPKAFVKLKAGRSLT